METGTLIFTDTFNFFKSMLFICDWMLGAIMRGVLAQRWRVRTHSHTISPLTYRLRSYISCWIFGNSIFLFWKSRIWFKTCHGFIFISLNNQFGGELVADSDWGQFCKGGSKPRLFFSSMTNGRMPSEDAKDETLSACKSSIFHLRQGARSMIFRVPAKFLVGR